MLTACETRTCLLAPAPYLTRGWVLGVRLHCIHVSTIMLTTGMGDSQHVRARYAWQHAAPPQDERAAAEDAARAAAREARRRATRAALQARQNEVQPSRHRWLLGVGGGSPAACAGC